MKKVVEDWEGDTGFRLPVYSIAITGNLAEIDGRSDWFAFLKRLGLDGALAGSAQPSKLKDARFAPAL